MRATVELLAEVGFDGLTMEGIAQRAEVGKATVYRRWGSREDLVIEAIGGLISEIAIPDTGNIEDDLLQLIREGVRVYSGTAGAVMPGLISALAHHRRLASSLRDGFVRPRRAALQAVLERGVRRGELRRDLDYELALDFLSGPLYYRLLFTGGSIDEHFARGAVEVMLQGLSQRDRVRGGAGIQG